jgi:hypothetical protein
MLDWMTRIAELPHPVLVVALVAVMMLDTLPLVGVLVPGDAVILLVMSTTGWLGGGSTLVGVVAGCLAIFPGSMGTSSYIVRGLGNEDSYCPAAHLKQIVTVKG